MALINCSECNAQISNTAKNCPKCGAPVVKGEAKVEEKSIPETVNNNFNPEPKKKGNGLLIAIIGGGLLIIAVIAFLFMNNGPSKEEIEARERTKADSISAVEKAMLDAMAAAEAEAAALGQNQEIQENSNTGIEWNYSGAIDKYPIKAFINYGEGVNSEGTGALEIPITGYYFYESQNQKIPIEGSSNGAGVIYFIAHTNGGEETFEGQFTESMLEDFTGTWEKNGKSLNFKLLSKK